MEYDTDNLTFEDIIRDCSCADIPATTLISQLLGHISHRMTEPVFTPTGHNDSVPTRLGSVFWRCIA